MIKNQTDNGDEVDARIRNTAGVTAALKKAAKRAVSEHARDGQPVVIWRDGQVVWEEAKKLTTNSAEQ